MIVLELCAAIVLAIMSITMLVVLPPVGQCPAGWSLHEGVRRTGDRVGEFACLAPLPACCGEPAGKIECQRQCPPVQRFHSRIYCTGGMLPIVVDHRTVGCSR